MANPESILKNKIFIGLSRVMNGMFWNHPTGQAVPIQAVKALCEKYGRYGAMHDYMALQRIKFGCKGSSDILGVTSVTVTPEMVGRKVGVITCIEVKTSTGRQSPDQKCFQRNIESYNGIYIVATSFADINAHVQFDLI